ncbi:MAG: MauE/DoxX family redox-associated membrane protein [Halieaceae bacterium]
MPEFLVISIALFLAWLFATAGMHKLRSPAWYAGLISRYLDVQKLSRGLVVVVAISELACAILLLLNETRVLGLVLAAILLVAYAALMMLQLQRGRADMNCGCAGPASDTTISPGLVYRNLVCAGLAVLAATLPLQGAEWSLALLVTSALVSLFLALVYIACEQLIANSQRFSGAF